MATDRRTFLRLSLAASALASAPRSLLARPAGRAEEKLRLLVFGGTGFIGPHLVRHALERGHEVTLFNRGRTNTHLFPDLEKIVGDRDPDKGEGIRGLEGREWDAVLDDNGYYPRHVRATAELLADKVGHYVYVSSISAYASFAEAGLDEDSPVATLEDPTVETMGENYAYYGGLKALCEQAAQAAFGKRSAVIRPGYIVGPGDFSDRFTYWPVRIDRGGDALIPGTPKDPIQVIDVRDLAEWMVRVVEARTGGVFNACGPKDRLEWGRVIDACVKASEHPAQPHWVAADVLAEHEHEPFPIWADPSGEEAHVHEVSNARAVAAGLTFRPIATTIEETLAWHRTRPEEQQAKLRAGLSPETEERILKAVGAV